MAEDLTRYSDLCRLCASKTSFIGIHIFENEGEVRQLSKKIENCLPVQIHEADELPKLLCNNCVCKLEFVAEFREKSAKTDRVLKELFKGHTGRLHQPHILVDQNELIMVQSHELLNDHNLQNIDLSLNQRDEMMVEHEFILGEPNVDNSSHPLDGIELEATQDSILVNSTGNTQSLQDSHFEDENLSLIHSHHLLNDQLRLHDGLHVNINGDNSVNIALNNQNIKGELHNNENYLPSYNSTTKEPEMFDDSINDLHIDHQYNENITSEMKLEDSNSTNSMLTAQDNDHYVTHSDKTNFVQIIQASDKNWYYCNMCEKAFEQKLEFEKHYDSHFYRCQECLQVFSTMDSLNEHKMLHTTEEDAGSKPINTRLKSSTVPVKVENKLNLESNSEESDCDNGQIEEEGVGEVEEGNATEAINNNKKKKWTPKICQICGNSYKTNYKLGEHMRKHTGEKPFKCGSCDKAFRSKIGLTQHEAVHTGQYSYSCSTCGKGFQCKSYLMGHQRVHSNAKPYHCTTCGQNFKTKQSLLDHTNRHLGLKPYICHICGRGFITKGLCRSHEKIHTGTDNRKYACKICTKMFVSKSYLQTHLRIHTGEKPFKCEVCEKGFLTRVDLKIHSTLHTGEKSFVCEICGKAFARRDALRCHTRSHTGERPYSCEICGQTFTQFTPMAIHKRLHTGERPYTCETCGKSFVSRSTMMSHAKKHDRG